jgi:acyl-CoA thioester hydrolase
MSAVQAHVRYRVPYADTDQMRVVYYANYLIYFEMARNELLRQVGFPYREIEARGFGLPVLEAQVHYHAAARYDDELDIRGWIGWLKPVRIRVDCAVFCGSEVLAEGHTVHACVQLSTLRPVRIPEEIAGSLRGALSAAAATISRGGDARSGRPGSPAAAGLSASRSRSGVAECGPS